jgi:acid stress-induced BolA-like protein IbaG/YrbA
MLQLTCKEYFNRNFVSCFFRENDCLTKVRGIFAGLCSVKRGQLVKYTETMFRALVRGIFAGLCSIKRGQLVKYTETMFRALVRGIFAGLCSVKRRQLI